MRQLWVMLTMSTLGACATHQGPTLPYRFEASPTHGEIRVLPVLDLSQRHEIDRSGYIGAGVCWEREWVRRDRTEALAQVPEAVGRAVPGAVHGALGEQWRGQFRDSAFPVGGRQALRSALDDLDKLDATLSDVARRNGGDASLFVWIRDLEGLPLTTTGFPGDIVSTRCGPVVLDTTDEPYQVTASLGIALVKADGEVVLRYDDRFDAVLSARKDPDVVAYQLARSLARDVELAWPSDPRLDWQGTLDTAPGSSVAAQ